MYSCRFDYTDNTRVTAMERLVNLVIRLITLHTNNVDLRMKSILEK
jgi:hypothetical protein